MTSAWKNIELICPLGFKTEYPLRVDAAGTKVVGERARDRRVFAVGKLYYDQGLELLLFEISGYGAVVDIAIFERFQPEFVLELRT